MFEKEIMISSVRRQKELLDELTHSLEKKDLFLNEDFELYDTTLRRVESNMKRLRKSAMEYQVPLRSSAGQVQGLIRRILN